MVPAQYRQSGFTDYLAPGVNWATALKSLDDDEFCLDPTRMTLVCGTAGFDGTQFKGILANEYNIQVNKTSRNSVLLQSNINNTRSDVAHLIRVLAEIAGEVDRGLTQGGANARKTFEARVKSLMTDVPDLPNFSHFHDSVPRRCRHQDQRRRYPQRLLLPPMTRRAASTSALPIPRSTAG